MNKEEKRIVFLNPKTCGIYKSGGLRFKTDHSTGRRTEEIDNELLDAVNAYIDGGWPDCRFDVDESKVFSKKIIVPNYYDTRYNNSFRELLKQLGTTGITLGALLDQNIISVRGGHGSPGNDQRAGHIPYIKVSDVRAMRINVNPTNLVSKKVAERYWRGSSSGIEAWDVITPNRASSNIGEFAIIIPGEEQVVLTKEFFVFRVTDNSVWDHFYLFWALSLKAVREQWKRIALMQTNREDCGDRHREIILPKPQSKEWATEKSKVFRDYFNAISKARADFSTGLSSSGLKYIASALGGVEDDIEDDPE